VDLVGKSTQIESLKEFYPEAVFTREPGATELGSKIRDILLFSDYIPHKRSEFLLFLADRSEHYQKVIKPALSSEKPIISDRSVFSGLAYGSGADDDRLWSLSLFSVENRLPDLIFLFEIDRDTLIERRAGKRGDNIEIRGVEYAINVQKRLRYWLEKSGVKFITIDASLPADEVGQKIQSKIRSLLR
jgi:dTMP kinase